MRLLTVISLLLTGLACKSPAKKFLATGTGTYQYPGDTLREPAAGTRYFSDKPGVTARNGMVCSAHPEASRVGVEILKAGGNAVDAAIAVQFALAVVHPAAGNIGGGGFMVYRASNGQAYTLDFREKAPLAAGRDMYLDKTGNVIAGMSTDGHLAAGVPGTVAGMIEAHRRFGRLPWSRLVEPAVQLAEKGVKLTEREAMGLNLIREDLLMFSPGKTCFLNDDSWKAGDLLVQQDLASTLKRIRDEQERDFYSGRTAELLVKEMGGSGGLITREDLATYRAVWREPVTARYKGFNVISMGPPSSGGIALIQLLKMTERYPLNRWGWNADSTAMLMIEAERRVYADRSRYAGDPDFIKVPVEELTSTTYLNKRMADFSFTRASESPSVGPGLIPGYESMETTHFSIVDKEGNAVAITTTLNWSYGNRVVVAGAGFLLNNEMDDFSARPGIPNAYGLTGSTANAIHPGKRMLSSMTPTILEKDGRLFMVAGTPGGPTIITSVFQTILNVVEHGMTMQQAVNALKFHHQWKPDKVSFEPGAFSPATIDFLQKKGVRLEKLAGTLGRMDCILVREDGLLEGGSDPRGDNTAVGY